MVLVCLLYCSGGFILLTLFHVGQTLLFLLKLSWKPPGKNGELCYDFQKQAFLGRFVEVQLESAPQSCLQMVIILYQGVDDWVQILSVAISILSVAKGTMDSIVMMKSGHRRISSSRESIMGMILIIPETLLRFFTYSILIIFCANESGLIRYIMAALFGILLLLYFIIVALTSNTVESFAYSVFSSIYSPLLFLKEHPSGEKWEENYIKSAKHFYAKNKLVTSTVLLTMLTIVFCFGAQPSLEQDKPELKLFQFDCSSSCLPSVSSGSCRCSEDGICLVSGCGGGSKSMFFSHKSRKLRTTAL